MQEKFLLLHGWGGSDNPHWQSWLAGEIAKDYGNVSFLRFSDYDTPLLEVWKKELLQSLEEFKPDIVICHSLANTLWFHLCNDKTIKQNIKKLFLVAPPCLHTDIEELKSFFPVQIPSNLYSEDAILVTSTNDPYMNMDEANRLKESLNVEMKTLQDAGHINADSGYGEWNWILQELKK